MTKYIDEEQVLPVEQVPVGEYVRKINKNGEPQQKVYTRQKFCRFEKDYQLDDVDDISRAVYVKKGTLLLVGFTY